jgi:NADP-dependent 3-hydroxy acid dehydrogenase YdfG
MSQKVKVVLVTGASSGIGRATALALAEAGYHVYATNRHPEKMSDLRVRGLNVLSLDVSDEASMTATG